MDATRGPRSPPRGRRGPTSRTSCRPRTRSPPTSPTSTRSRSTSTGSPTPRAPPCSSSSSPTSGATTSWPACARYFAAHSCGNATLADLLSALEEVSGRDLTAWSREWLETAGRQHAAAVVHASTTAGRFTVVLGPAVGRRRRIPTLRSHRIAIGLYSLDGRRAAPHGDSVETDVTGDRHRRCPSWSARPARPGAGQRRRPDLRQDPARRRTRCAPRSRSIGSFTSSLPAALVLGGGLGHDQGRRDGRAGLRAAGARRRGLGAGHQRGADAAAAGRAGGPAVRRPGLARRRGSP